MAIYRFSKWRLENWTD